MPGRQGLYYSTQSAATASSTYLLFAAENLVPLKTNGIIDCRSGVMQSFRQARRGQTDMSAQDQADKDSVKEYMHQTQPLVGQQERCPPTSNPLNPVLTLTNGWCD